jgi:hypothetical protein
MHQTRRARRRRARARCEPTTSPPRRSCGTTRPLASTRSLVRNSLSHTHTHAHNTAHNTRTTHARAALCCLSRSLALLRQALRQRGADLHGLGSPAHWHRLQEGHLPVLSPLSSSTLKSQASR